MEKKNLTAAAANNSRCISGNVCFCSMLMLGALFVCGGSILLFKFPDILNAQISKQLMLIEGTEAAERFENPPLPTYLRIHVFNVTNPEEVNFNFTKPKLVEVGPYVYRQVKRKIIKEWNDTLGTVTYQEIPSFYYEESMSLKDGLDKEVYHVNAPDVGVANFLRGRSLFGWSLLPLSSILSAFGIEFGPLVVKHTVRELLFDGYRCEQLENLFIQYGDLLQISEDLMPNFTFGVFYGRNNTPTKDLTVNTGLKGMTDFGEIVRFNDSDVLPYWVKDSGCAELNGTDGTSFPPHLDKTKPLYAFSPDVCRSLKMVYSEPSQVKGIDTYRYVGPPELFEANDDNMCFCMRDLKECNRSGVLPIASCQKGAPVVLSLPHFLMGDSDFRNIFEGLEPSHEKHDSYLDIEPMTGLVLRGQKRLQANIEVRPDSNFEFLENAKHMVFPLLWLSEEGVVDEDKAAEIRDRLLFPVELGFLGLKVLVYTGVCLIMVTASLFTVVKCCFKHRSQYVKNRASFSSGKELGPFNIECQPLHEMSLSGKIVKSTLKNGFHLLPTAKEGVLCLPISK